MSAVSVNNITKSYGTKKVSVKALHGFFVRRNKLHFKTLFNKVNSFCCGASKTTPTPELLANACNTD